jgi:hypothetical protein
MSVVVVSDRLIGGLVLRDLWDGFARRAKVELSPAIAPLLTNRAATRIAVPFIQRSILPGACLNPTER